MNSAGQIFVSFEKVAVAACIDTSACVEDMRRQEPSLPQHLKSLRGGGRGSVSRFPNGCNCLTATVYVMTMAIRIRNVESTNELQVVF